MECGADAWHAGFRAGCRRAAQYESMIPSMPIDYAVLNHLSTRAVRKRGHSVDSSRVVACYNKHATQLDFTRQSGRVHPSEKELQGGFGAG